MGVATENQIGSILIAWTRCFISHSELHKNVLTGLCYSVDPFAHIMHPCQLVVTC